MQEDIFVCKFCIYVWVFTHAFAFGTLYFGMSWHGRDANNYLQNAHFKYRWSEVSKTAIVAGKSGIFWRVWCFQGRVLCAVAFEKQNFWKRLPNDCHKWWVIYKVQACDFWWRLPWALRSSKTTSFTSSVSNESFESKSTDLCNSFTRQMSILYKQQKYFCVFDLRRFWATSYDFLLVHCGVKS